MAVPTTVHLTTFEEAAAAERAEDFGETSKVRVSGKLNARIYVMKELSMMSQRKLIEEIKIIF